MTREEERALLLKTATEQAINREIFHAVIAAVLTPPTDLLPPDSFPGQAAEADGGPGDSPCSGPPSCTFH